MSAVSISSCSSAQLHQVTNDFITLRRSSTIQLQPRKQSTKNSLYIDQESSGTISSVDSAHHQSLKWRTRVSFFPSFLTKGKDVESLKQELFEAIAPLDRGSEATPEDQERVDQIARKVEAVNQVKEPLKSSFLNGKWELLYTTSKSILQTQV